MLTNYGEYFIIHLNSKFWIFYNITKGDNGKIKQITRDNSSCHGASNLSLIKDLNYPAIVISVAAHKPFNIKFPKTFANVGSHNATYKDIITPISNVKITVEPNLLSFKSLQETHSFVATVVGRLGSRQTALSSLLVLLQLWG